LIGGTTIVQMSAADAVYVAASIQNASGRLLPRNHRKSPARA
jgi:hypothetical protein